MQGREGGACALIKVLSFSWVENCRDEALIAVSASHVAFSSPISSPPVVSDKLALGKAG